MDRSGARAGVGDARHRVRTRGRGDGSTDAERRVGDRSPLHSPRN
eukprot:CAMPEP_0179719158 /NCGR_PEP_ID=MMETSP0938-20121108/3282_1 /TAXON_ID=548131 ORGANISM="Ostreococcus mediterraneus, Strain clade-D-RCC1107" /NCGR_SAMPLE_ID=MMETSP0938 /ASSEMBLY_ACC=CAM_ASM_000576 /LENGTH=44 /DNA_ID= /DNA_START= /DNA_END= /DNA_ORIENTATION=